MSRFGRLCGPAVFGPDLLHLMQSAFDRAWAMYDAEFAAPSKERDRARDALAKAIVDEVERGERDIARLKQHGLRQLLRFRNSTMPNGPARHAPSSHSLTRRLPNRL